MLLRRAAAPPTARSSARPAAAPGGPRRARASQRSTTPTASAQQQQQQPAPQPPPAAPPSKQPPAAATRAELVSFCWAEVAALRAACAAAESSGEGNGGHRAALAAAHPLHRADAANLAHYLAVRGFELRGLQAALHSLGLSSLGHAESSVAPHLDAVAAALAALAAAERVQLPPPPPGLPKGWPLAAVGAGKVPAADDGAARLRAHARAALGACAGAREQATWHSNGGRRGGCVVDARPPPHPRRGDAPRDAPDGDPPV